MLWALQGSLRYSWGPQKDLFWPNSFSFMAPFWFKKIGRNIGKWGVQSAATERPAHAALLFAIWNHPGAKHCQIANNINFGSLFMFNGIVWWRQTPLKHPNDPLDVIWARSAKNGQNVLKPVKGKWINLMFLEL